MSFQKTGSDIVTKVKFHPNKKNTTNLVLSTFRGNIYACYNEQSPTISLYHKRVGAISISQYGYTTYAVNTATVCHKGARAIWCQWQTEKAGRVCSSLLSTRRMTLFLREHPCSSKVPQANRGSIKQVVTKTRLSVRISCMLTMTKEGNVTYGVSDKDYHYYYKLSTLEWYQLGFLLGCPGRPTFQDEKSGEGLSGAAA